MMASSNLGPEEADEEERSCVELDGTVWSHTLPKLWVRREAEL